LKLSEIQKSGSRKSCSRTTTGLLLLGTFSNHATGILERNRSNHFRDASNYCRASSIHLLAGSNILRDVHDSFGRKKIKLEKKSNLLPEASVHCMSEAFLLPGTHLHLAQIDYQRATPRRTSASCFMGIIGLPYLSAKMHSVQSRNGNCRSGAATALMPRSALVCGVTFFSPP
jgi:hypothetical protein